MDNADLGFLSAASFPTVWLNHACTSINSPFVFRERMCLTRKVQFGLSYKVEYLTRNIHLPTHSEVILLFDEFKTYSYLFS